MWLTIFVAVVAPAMALVGGVLSGCLPDATKARYAKNYYGWFKLSVYGNLVGWALLLTTLFWLPEHLTQVHWAKREAAWHAAVATQADLLRHQHEKLEAANEAWVEWFAQVREDMKLLRKRR